MDRNIFDDEHEMFRDAARSFYKNEVQPHGERWREQGIVDREAFLKAGEQGLLLMWADEKYGGAGVKDFRYEQILIEEIARHGDPGFFMTLHSRLVGPYIGELGTEEQKQRWLPKCVSGENVLAVAITEPGAGSDVSGIRTKAEDKGDHFLLNGSKVFISNGILADLVIVVARTGDSKRALSLLVVERGMDGFERGKNLKKMGLKSQDTAELFFNNVKVPKENLLGELDRVPDQIDQNLTGPQRVRPHPRRHAGRKLGPQLEPLRVRLDQQIPQHVPQQIVRRHRLRLQLHSPGLDLRHIQNVGDHLEQILARPMDVVGVLHVLLRSDGAQQF